MVKLRPTTERVEGVIAMTKHKGMKAYERTGLISGQSVLKVLSVNHFNIENIVRGKVCQK